MFFFMFVIYFLSLGAQNNLGRHDPFALFNATFPNAEIIRSFKIPIVRFQHFNEFLCCHCFNLFQFRFLSNHDNTTQSCSSFYWCNCNFSFCDVMKYCDVWIHVCVTHPNPKNANPKRQQIQNDDGELHDSFFIHSLWFHMLLQRI